MTNLENDILVSEYFISSVFKDEFQVVPSYHYNFASEIPVAGNTAHGKKAGLVSSDGAALNAEIPLLIILPYNAEKHSGYLDTNITYQTIFQFQAVITSISSRETMKLMIQLLV